MYTFIFIIYKKNKNYYSLLLLFNIFSFNFIRNFKSCQILVKTLPIYPPT